MSQVSDCERELELLIGACFRARPNGERILEVFGTSAAIDLGAPYGWARGEILTVSVQPRRNVKVRWHLVIEDHELRERARAWLAKCRPDIVNSDEPDAVLVLAPVQ